jgi:hypothetical protein
VISSARSVQAITTTTLVFPRSAAVAGGAWIAGGSGGDSGAERTQYAAAARVDSSAEISSRRRSRVTPTC